MGPASCGHAALAHGRFQFPGGADLITRCWRCALLYPPLVGRAWRIALVVGTVLALINHGDHLVRRQATAVVALKILLTYLVPFGVAMWSALATARERKLS